MLRLALLTALIAAAALMPRGAHAEEKLVLKSVTADLPFGDRMFPDGPGSEAVNNNCLACHSPDMVLNQPPLPKATWEAEVNKMINTYKAPIDKADVPAIVSYLVQTNGKE